MIFRWLHSCLFRAFTQLLRFITNKHGTEAAKEAHGFLQLNLGLLHCVLFLIGTKGKRKRKKCTFLFNPKAPMALVLSVVVLDLLGGSGDLVSRVMSKVAIVVSTYNPN